MGSENCRRRGRAFTLVEILVALGVLAIGILGVTAVFIFGISSTEHGKNLSKATTYGRDILEIIRTHGLIPLAGTIPPPASSGLNDPPSARVALNQSPHGSFAQAMPANTGFFRNIKTERASTDPTSHLYNVYKVTVTIYWKEKGVERSMEMTAFAKAGN